MGTTHSKIKLRKHKDKPTTESSSVYSGGTNITPTTDSILSYHPISDLLIPADNQDILSAYSTRTGYSTVSDHRYSTAENTINSENRGHHNTDIKNIHTSDSHTKSNVSSDPSSIYPHFPQLRSPHKQELCGHHRLGLNMNNKNERHIYNDRQQRLHYFLKKVWNGIYQANLKDPGLIIHWGCGMGVWPMEMATLFPTCKVIGIDYEDAISSSLQHHLPNLEFMFISINGKLTGLEQIPSNSADYIMIRDVWLFITPSSEWDIVLDEAFRILKDGGLIEITEHLLHINSPGPETKKLESWFDKLYESLGADKKVRKSLKKYMAKAGFISIDTSSISVPLGEWAASKSLKESGYLIKDIMQREIRSLKKWIEGPNNISDTEFNQTVRVSMEEEVNEYRSTIEWVSVTGRKPGTHANIKINVPEFS